MINGSWRELNFPGTIINCINEGLGHGDTNLWLDSTFESLHVWVDKFISSIQVDVKKITPVEFL